MMELLKNRPLATICVASVLSMLLLVSICPDSIAPIQIIALALAVLSAAVIIIFALKHKNRALKTAVCFLLFVVICATLIFRGYSLYVKPLKTAEGVIGEECKITGEVLEVGYKNQYSERYYTKITELNGEATEILAVVCIDGESDLEKGDLFTMTAIGEEFENYENYLVSDGNVIKFTCEDVEKISITGQSEANFWDVFDRLNFNIQQRIYRLTDEESGSLIGALTLGNRDGLSSELERDFRRCGISHALALSGLHMTLIIGAFEMLMRLLRLDKRIRCVILILLSFSYLALTGFSMSASRAVIMLGFVYVGNLIWSESDSITSLALAVTLILAISPYAIFDISLWMSALATLGIIIIVEIISPLGYKIKKKSLAVQALYKLLVSVSVTLAAILFLSIFSWLSFGEISLIAPLSNLIITPVISLIIMGGLLMITLAPFLPSVAGFVGELLVHLVDVVTEMASSFSSLRGIMLSLKYDFVGYIIVPSMLALLLFLILKVKRKWTVAFIPLSMIIAFAACLSVHSYINRDISTVSYLRNGKSEILVITNGEAVTVCDISTGGYSNFSSACKTAFENCATEIDNIILTHYHSYHASSLMRICESNMVRNIYLPEPSGEDESVYYENIKLIMTDRGVNVKTYPRGYALDVGNGCDLNVSDPYYIERSNHPMFFVSVKTEMESSSNELLYFSSPIYENPSADHPTLPDHIVIGSHGPVIHRPPRVDMVEASRPSSVLLADGENMLTTYEIVARLEWLGTQGSDVIVDKHEYQFKIKK